MIGAVESVLFWWGLVILAVMIFWRLAAGFFGRDAATGRRRDDLSDNGP